MTQPVVLDTDRLPFTVNPRRLNLLVGGIAFCLPISLLLIAKLTGTSDFDSISHYYYSRFGSDIFVGSLSFIGFILLFLFSLRQEAAIEADQFWPVTPSVGHETVPVAIDGFAGFNLFDRFALKLAGVAAFVIAFFPTTGPGREFQGEAARVFIYAEAPFDAAMAALPRNQAGEEADTGSLSALVEANSEAAATLISFDLWEVAGLAQGNGVIATILNNLHGLAALVMFAVLGYISVAVFTRTQSPQSRKDETLTLQKMQDARTPMKPPKTIAQNMRALKPIKLFRNGLYITLGLIIFYCVLRIAVHVLTGDPTAAIAWNARNLTFWFEAFALWSFGLSWLIKGRFLPFLRD